MTDALIYRPFDRTIYRESREVVSNTHLPLTFGEVAEYRRPSLWPFVKVAFAGVFWFGVLIGGAAYVLGVF